MSDQIRYVGVSSSHGGKWQVEWSTSNNQGSTNYWGCPCFQDLSQASIPEGAECVLHDDVHGQHIHSDPFTYSAGGALLTVHIKDTQGHYDNWTVYPPCG